jgi:hypothetical protein
LADKKSTKIKSEYVMAKRGFLVPKVGARRRQYVVKPGEVFSASDPIVKKRRSLFAAVEDVVEQATAAPGELRALRSKSKSKSKSGAG